MGNTKKKERVGKKQENFAEKTPKSRESYWIQSIPPRNEPKLSKNLLAEVVVVGAGISGLSCAYMLASEGKKVVVLDAGTIGSGETGRTTAHLSNALDEGYVNIEKTFGASNAHLAFQSHTAAIDKIEEIIKKEKIDCDFSRLDGYLFLRPGDSIDTLEKELKAARKAGLIDVHFVGNSPLKFFDLKPALCFPGQGQLHILKYLNGLAKAIEKKGGKIFANTHVDKIAEDSVTTSDGKIIVAKNIIIATNVPIGLKVQIHSKQVPYRTYAIGLKVQSGSIPRALYWDTGTPYHYVRLQKYNNDYDLLIVGGEDHKTARTSNQTEKFNNLEKWARERFPMAESLDFAWSGQVIEPIDYLAFIGRAPGEDNIYIITGDSGHGITHGTIGGILITDLVMGRRSPWEGLYSPERKLLSVTKFVIENAGVAAQYIIRPIQTALQAEPSLGKKEGVVVMKGKEKVALYRDAKGKLFASSAVCPHLGCIVAWNDSEKTFDCPCHGSRFTGKGELINGPATKGLSKLRE
jgi:glycine/D-amino acid oxidase-like deaminating enzyme/nitrite reductase/ring-hydroxylating ferredoxin subunit